MQVRTARQSPRWQVDCSKAARDRTPAAPKEVHTPRRNIPETASIESAIGRVQFTVNALEMAASGDKELGEMARPLRIVLDDGHALAAEIQAARAEVTRASAIVHLRDGEADDLVQRISRQALVACDLDREHPLFRRLFPGPVAAIIRLGLESELPHLRGLQQQVGAEETPASLRREFARPIADAIARGEEAVRGREVAEGNVARVLARINVWRAEANRALVMVEGGLRRTGAAQRRAPRWADAFFPRSRRRSPPRTAAAPSR